MLQIVERLNWAIIAVLSISDIIAMTIIADKFAEMGSTLKE